MSAADNLHNDQFIDVFHSSFDEVPPHMIAPSKFLAGHLSNLPGNEKGELLFAGTRRAAVSRSSRDWLHSYRIPKSMIRPETWGDDLKDPKSGIYTWSQTGEQPELFEMLPADTSLVNPKTVIKYRNSVEDSGSISHIFHKGSVHSGLIKYLGVEPRRSQ